MFSHVIESWKKVTIDGFIDIGYWTYTHIYINIFISHNLGRILTQSSLLTDFAWRGIKAD